MFAPSFNDLWKNWKPPDELNRAAPRETELTRSGIAITVLAVIFLVGAVGGSIAFRVHSNHVQQELDLLMAQGQVTQGTVTRKWRSGGKSPQNMVTYDFEAAGGSYTGRSSFSRTPWSEMAEGGPIDIRYLPSDPSRNFPVLAPIHPDPWAVTILFGVCLLIAPAILGWQISRERALVRDGTAAPGVVTGNRTAKGNRVDYSFSALGGERYSGRYACRYMEPGTPVCILYDTENPRRNILYPGQFVRAKARY